MLYKDTADSKDISGLLGIPTVTLCNQNIIKYSGNRSESTNKLW